MELKIRPVEEEDCRLLWEWVNDPQVRSSSFRPGPISWEEHRVWFGSKRRDAGCFHYLVTDERQRPVGQVRFDRLPDGSVETDISIARDFRGRGIGSRMLHLACEALSKTGGIRKVVAYIRPENKASRKVFQKAGFSFQGKNQVNGCEAFRWDLEL